MDNSTVLKESIENLTYFEYYKFKKSFGLAFLIIGLLDSIAYILISFSFLTHFSEPSSYNPFFNPFLIFILVFFILQFIICGYLIIIITSSKKTQIKNGVLTKAKTTIGILFIILGIIFAQFISDLAIEYIFNSVNPYLIFSGYDWLIEGFMRYFILIGLYFIETKLFFPHESNKSIVIISLILFLILIIDSLIWYVFLLLYPGWNPIAFADYYPYFLFISLILGIIFSLYGLFEMRSLPTIKRVFHE